MQAAIVTAGATRRTKVKPAFRCPHCGDDLVEESSRFVCAARHSFDRAREGYVNLLPGGRLQRSRTSASDPGDDEAMLAARRQVFDAGLYRPVLDAVAEAVAATRPLHVLDSGCGEGSYLAAVTERCAATATGIDIAKTAIRMAARRHSQHRYAVASAYVLPFADECFDVVVNVFAPRDFVEMARVLRRGGRAVVVTPGPDHLRELKSIVYEHLRFHPGQAGAGGALHLTEQQPIRIELPLADPLHREALLRMTPFWWSATASQRHEVTATVQAVTVDMMLSIYSSPA
ncbi:MAG: methyltransferase domain-containing protein [Ilumatobacteraceae bacterium]